MIRDKIQEVMGGRMLFKKGFTVTLPFNLRGLGSH